MAITITIEAANADELRQLMQDAAETLAGMKTEDIADTKVSTIETKPETKKTEKPKKEVASEPVSENKVGSVESNTDIPTVEKLREKAQTIKDKASVKALLDEFGAKNLTTLPEDRRAEFLARLEEL